MQDIITQESLLLNVAVHFRRKVVVKMQDTSVYGGSVRSSPPRRRMRPKKNFSGAGFIVFILACAILAILSTTVFFNIEAVTVNGSSNYTVEEIVEASGIRGGDNMVRLNTEKCSAQILSKLVYIEDAVITRRFPHTIQIDVTASVPAANFICDESVLLISSGGKILDEIAEPKAGLLDFYGTSPAETAVIGTGFASADETKTTIIYRLMELFGNRSIENIGDIDVTDNSNICYTYDGRITVELGNINEIEYKLSFADEIITQKIGENTEGILTILSSGNQASFMDKATLENNALVYNRNMELRNSETGVTDEDGNVITENFEETTSTYNDPIME